MVLEIIILVVGGIISILTLLKYMGQFYWIHTNKRVLREQGIDELPSQEELKEAMDFMMDNFGPKKIKKEKENEEENKKRGMFQ